MQVVTILGSNSGNKRQLITEAIRILSSTEQWVMASSFYETAPWGFECDENFLNQVVVFKPGYRPSIFYNVVSKQKNA